MDSEVDGNEVPQLRAWVREKEKGKALLLPCHLSMNLLPAGFLGQLSVSGFTLPHSSHY